MSKLKWTTDYRLRTSAESHISHACESVYYCLVNGERAEAGSKLQLIDKYNIAMTII